MFHFCNLLSCEKNLHRYWVVFACQILVSSCLWLDETEKKRLLSFETQPYYSVYALKCLNGLSPFAMKSLWWPKKFKNFDTIDKKLILCLTKKDFPSLFLDFFKHFDGNLVVQWHQAFPFLFLPLLMPYFSLFQVHSACSGLHVEKRDFCCILKTK